MTGLYRLLRDIQLGGRTRRESRAQDGPGEDPPDQPPARSFRPLISRPNVRTGLAGALLGCIAGAAAALVVAPWVVLVLPFPLVGGIVLLALDDERRQARCRRCGAADEESGLCAVCATVRRQEDE